MGCTRSADNSRPVRNVLFVIVRIYLLIAQIPTYRLWIQAWYGWYIIDGNNDRNDGNNTIDLAFWRTYRKMLKLIAASGPVLTLPCTLSFLTLFRRKLEFRIIIYFATRTPVLCYLYRKLQ